MRTSATCRLMKLVSDGANFETFKWGMRKMPTFGKTSSRIPYRGPRESSQRLLLPFANHYSGMREKTSVSEKSKQSKDDWGGPEAEKLIIQLADNFTDVIKEYDSLMVYFYTTWCSHCKKFKSTYGGAAVKMAKEGIPGRLGAVDLTKRMDIADMFHIVAVPILKYFRKGQFMMIYNKNRTVDDIVQFMKDPPSKPMILPKIDI